MDIYLHQLKNENSRFNYDKINFNINEYNLYPITQEFTIKDPKRMNHFYYYNKDKDDHYITNKNIQYINKEYLKVWDPITTILIIDLSIF